MNKDKQTFIYEDGAEIDGVEATVSDGEQFDVALFSVPSTGYNWELAELPEGLSLMFNNFRSVEPQQLTWSRVENSAGTKDYVAQGYRISPRYIDEVADGGEKATYWDVEGPQGIFAQENTLGSAKETARRDYEKRSEEVAGAGCYDEFSFVARGSVQGQLVFHYRRPWSDEPQVRGFALYINS